MSRSKAIPTSGIGSNLQPGKFLQRRGESYCILPIPADEDDGETVKLLHVDSGAVQTITTRELFDGGGGDTPLVFAPTLALLKVKATAAKAPEPIATAAGVPDALVARANLIADTVETVEAMIAEAEAMAIVKRETFRRTEATKSALKRLDPPISAGTYYNYRAIYRKNGRSRKGIASESRRSTFCHTKMTAAQLHFVDIMQARKYGVKNSGLRPGGLYKLLRAH